MLSKLRASGICGQPPVAIRIVLAVSLRSPTLTHVGRSGGPVPQSVRPRQRPEAVCRYLPAFPTLYLLLRSRQASHELYYPAPSQTRTHLQYQQQQLHHTPVVFSAHIPITHVPPGLSSSITATCAPCPAAIRPARTPPDPAPITIRS